MKRVLGIYEMVFWIIFSKEGEIPNMIDESNVSAHYSNTDLYKMIENGLIELGISLDSVNIENLSLVDDFHIGGATATQFISDRLNLDREKTILDIGCGIGGPARYMAKMSGCKVHGIDLTQNYIETGIQLNALVGLDDKVNLKQGSALALPYDNFSFDGAYMIHVGMNIERKNQLMAEVFRVLKGGNNFVLFDVMKITDEAIDYPMPWAEKIEESAVDKVQAYEAALGEAGFRILDVEDKNQFF